MIDFSVLHGNEDLKKHLAAAIESRTLSHAYIIEGAEGSGRRTLSRLVAAALACQCEGKRPCGSCSMCEKILNDNSADVHVLSSDGDKSIGVSQIKELREDMYLSATECEYKVYIIHNAEAMTVQAQNALLIILEEPPENTLIFLLTKNSSLLLPTIRSRAQVLRTSLFTADELTELLPRISREAAKTKAEFPENFAALMQSAGGSIGGALDVIKSENASRILDKRGLINDVIDAIAKRRPFAEIFDALRGFPQKRAELSDHLSLFALAVRDLILLKKCETAPLVYFEDRERASETATRIGISRLFKLYESAEAAIADIDANANTTALITALAYSLRD